MSYLANMVPVEAEAYIKECVRQAKAQDLESFACDWAEPGASHLHNTEACVERMLGHLMFVVPEYRQVVAQRVVSSWGYLGREDIDARIDDTAPIQVHANPNPAAWPFPK